MYSCRTRSQIWDFLHSIEFEGKTYKLNEVMAVMTDSNIELWFIEVASLYIVNKGLSNE